tara:strand:- start:2355 stop:3107 length:753 start_codon:yes stop_codon:yes gene_type:complete
MGALFLSETVFATGKPGYNWKPPKQNHTCQGGHNCNQSGGAQTQTQAQEQGQKQGQVAHGGEGGTGIGGNSRANSMARGGHGGSASADGGAGGSVGDIRLGGDTHSSESDNSNQSDVNVADYSLTSVTTEYEAVAETVSSLNLAHCSDGGSVGDDSRSFNIGGVNYICEITMAMPVALLIVEAELAAARNCKDDSEMQQEHLARAHEALEEAKAMASHAADYVDNRSWTANIGSFFRDTWWGFAILLLVI